MSTTTTNMLLTVPGVATEPGPEYASQINGDLNIIDAHDHSTGKGVPVTPSGININANLPFNGNNAVTLRSTRFQAQGTPLTSTASSDIGCTYVSGVDLYYNDLSGNQIRLTQGGGVAGAAGSITNLASPATAEYVSASSKFVWQSDVNVAATMDFRSAILRNAGAGSFGLTLQAPTLSSNYSLTLPSLPAATNFMTVDNAGNMGANIAVANGITRTMQAAVGQATSSTSGAYVQTASSTTPVLSLSLTTTGRPVMLMLQSAGATPTTFSYFSSIRFSFARDSSAISVVDVTSPASLNVFPSSFQHLDAPAAGTYVYSFRASVSSGAFLMQAVQLVAWEL